ncbi:MAG: 4-hydroxythreonine-4-phosphate dehydrogenase PdxA [Kiritimatiellia bacterium]
MALPVIGLTMGDPSGIGPELCLQMLALPALRGVCRMQIYGSRALLARVGQKVGLDVPEDMLVYDDVDLDAAGVVPGQVQAACGAAAARCVERAVADAQARRIVAVVTAPLHKEALHAAGYAYPGHTEMLAALTGQADVCMMMASADLQVCLVTTHVALAQVSPLVTRARVLGTIRLADTALRRQGVARPRITVCGLNPHAGEAGAFGCEDADEILPAVEAACSRGYLVQGPLPADTAFLPHVRARTDVYVAMYHDQGLIPFKMVAFESGVNVTLGLPIVRTSPDHGTAFDLAWRGTASGGSMHAAVEMALRLARG